MNLIFDEEYLDEVLMKTEGEGSILDEATQSYLRIMKDIRRMAIISGELSDALRQYSLYAGRLSGVVKQITQDASDRFAEYITGIEEMDQYVF